METKSKNWSLGRITVISLKFSVLITLLLFVAEIVFFKYEKGLSPNQFCVTLITLIVSGIFLGTMILSLVDFMSKENAGKAVTVTLGLIIFFTGAGGLIFFLSLLFNLSLYDLSLPLLIFFVCALSIILLAPEKKVKSVKTWFFCLFFICFGFTLIASFYNAFLSEPWIYFNSIPISILEHSELITFSILVSAVGSTILAGLFVCIPKWGCDVFIYLKKKRFFPKSFKLFLRFFKWCGKQFTTFCKWMIR